MGAILHTTSGEPITYIEHEQVVPAKGSLKYEC